ncbi:MAG TPA: RcpC/CpaB family pilus assembly protein [Anaerolineales bacterium]|nr:RcpC/CpaB family pilus assembly protein [Anaerolineales bacterium]
MARGTRLLLILIILIVILSGIAYVFMNTDLLNGLIGAQTQASVETKQVVALAATVNEGEEITAAALTMVALPAAQVSEDLIVDPNLVVGKFAKVTLSQGVTVTQNMVSDKPGLSTGGPVPANAQRLIPPGMVAVTIPIEKLNSVGYGIQDGNHVNVIATASFYDVDPEFQTKFPNQSSGITGPTDLNGIRPEMVSQSSSGIDGRAEQDGNLQQYFYVVPSELQRPRTVSQMILQNVEVLHIGTFIDTRPPETRDENGNPVPQPPLIPDVISLIVTPQDAIALSYLLELEVRFNLTLRNDEDINVTDTVSTDMEYFLSQYNVVIPEKLPYIMDNNIYYPTTP